ncbi:gamma-butyrobetaine dioxygenase-like [Antedon mediterranea]|uniref:gamma-butyrobetaine dioxygenase-like n=1 Tax=Antedon mediterranea TaxID=105859 RepID=UPI003AF418FA
MWKNIMLCSKNLLRFSFIRSLGISCLANNHISRAYSSIIHPKPRPRPKIIQVLSSRHNPNKPNIFSRVGRQFSASPTDWQRLKPVTDAVNIASSSVSEDGEFVHVTWDNGENALYPYAWIRDNCPCTKCFNINEDISERLVPLNEQNLNDKASATTVDESGQSVHVIGTDGHSSPLDASWLFDRQLCRKKPLDGYQPVLWNAHDIEKAFPMFDYADVLQDNDALKAWLEALKMYGIAMLQNAPTKELELIKLGKRVSFLREAMWGLISSIKSKPNSYVLAYTPKKILLHSDMMYMSLTPGVVLLHCLSLPACTGGENWLVDGFYAAKVLKEKDPQAYDILTKVKMEHGITGIEHGSYFEHRMSKPTISLNEEGDPVCISYHEHLRTSNVSASSVEEVAEFYRALKIFSDILYDPENMYKRRLLEGEIFTVSNIRLLHGRDDFVVSEDKARHIESGYLDWDEIDSRLRVLQRGK